MGDNPHLATVRATGRKGATSAQCTANCLQKKSKGVLADGTLDKCVEGTSND